MLKKLDEHSIQALCANQVILDLAGCLKELIENSIDAKSNSINILLENYGKDYIEVSDNGTGIDMKSTSLLTQKGATSKLREFEDLNKIETYGFRGEALNSLRLLSELVIITRTKDDDNAWRYSFKNNGVVERTETSREVGTTVVIERIFGRIPVRFSDLESNIKAQYSKLCNMVSEYAIISLGVRIVMHNKVTGKKPELVLNSGTDFGNSMKNRIFMVLGSKFDESLEQFEFIIDENRSFSGFLLKNVTSGSGRENSWLKKNCIFCYVNSRPINMPKKLFDALTSVYKQYNTNRKVIAIINIRVRGEDLDLNLSPDKRDVYFNDENLLVEKFTESLAKFIENRNMTQKEFKPNNGESKQSQTKISDVFIKKSGNLNGPKGESQDSNNNGEPGENKENEQKESKKPLDGKKRTLDSLDDKSYEDEKQAERRVLRLKPEEPHEDKLEKVTPVKKTITLVTKKNEERYNEVKSKEDFEITRQKISPIDKSGISDLKNQLASKFKEKCQGHSSHIDKNINAGGKALELSSMKIKAESTEDNLSNAPITSRVNLNFDSNGKLKITIPTTLAQKNSAHNNKKPQREEPSGGIFEITKVPRASGPEILADDIEDIEKYSDLNQNSQKTEGSPNNEKGFEASTLVTSTNQAREIRDYDINSELLASYDEPDFTFKKEMFFDLKILGQYNSSFIITFLQNKNRIFIVDQHAADEKRNFERYFDERDFDSQILLRPVILSLPLLDMQIVKENKAVFEKNGFSFKILEDKGEVHINRLPCFKSLSFNKEDFLELIYMLRNENFGLYKKEDLRPNKVKAAIAMKACHTSVRAGKPLGYRVMREIVNNLGSLRSPWNCPHGRPTMVKSTGLLDMINKIKLEPPKRAKIDFEAIFCKK